MNNFSDPRESYIRAVLTDNFFYILHINRQFWNVLFLRDLFRSLFIYNLDLRDFTAVRIRLSFQMDIATICV